MALIEQRRELRVEIGLVRIREMLGEDVNAHRGTPRCAI
jgi:hypothetical protein